MGDHTRVSVWYRIPARRVPISSWKTGYQKPIIRDQVGSFGTIEPAKFYCKKFTKSEILWRAFSKFGSFVVGSWRKIKLVCMLVEILDKKPNWTYIRNDNKRLNRADLFIEHSECRICSALRVENASLLPLDSKKHPLFLIVEGKDWTRSWMEVVLLGGCEANDPKLDATAV